MQPEDPPRPLPATPHTSPLPQVYPKEEEYLYPPLTDIRYIGTPQVRRPPDLDSMPSKSRIHPHSQRVQHDTREAETRPPTPPPPHQGYAPAKVIEVRATPT